MGLPSILLPLCFTYVFNVPFGYWRAGVGKLSWQWVLAVHLPVPVIFTLRMVCGVGFELIPLFVAAFFLGQLTGGRLRRRLKEKFDVSLCLIVDILRMLRRRRPRAGGF